MSSTKVLAVLEVLEAAAVRVLPSRRNAGRMMQEDFVVTCPYCGEDVDVHLERDVQGSLVQDCEVCCNPWLVRVEGDDDERTVTVTRADGSE
jgi:Cysteine-rich CPXCG